MSKIFYISDPHFYHKKIIEKCNRPFSDVYEMNEAIIQNWKNTVKDEDKIYIAGDLGLYHAQDITNILNDLPGKKFLITGNHDLRNLEYRPLRQCFEKISFYEDIKDKDRRVVICHYPFEEWNGFYRDVYHIHGHVHKSPNGVALKELKNRFNVNVEFTGYKPVTLDELLQKTDEKEKE